MKVSIHGCCYSISPLQAARTGLPRRQSPFAENRRRSWRGFRLHRLSRRHQRPALSRLERLERYNIAYTVITQEDFAATASDEEAMEGLAEFISSLPDVAAILVLRDDGRGFVRGNWRTIRDDIDVGALAKTLGGGGHRKAAGFALPGRLIRCEGGWQVEN